jgi:hypothetical protein
LELGNEDDVLSLFDAWIRVPDNIPPEQADHYVAGLSGNISDQSSLSLEGYFKHYGSIVVYNRDKLASSDPDYIQGTGKSYGVELMVRSKVAWLDLYGAYSLSWATLNNAGFEYFPRYDRRHHLNLMVVGRPWRGITTAIRWEYGSGFPYTQTVGYFDQPTLDDPVSGQFHQDIGNPFLLLGSKDAARVPAYHRLDANLAYNTRLLGLNVSFGLDFLNVYDNKNFFYFDRKTGQRIDMLSFFPSATLTVTY